MGDYRKSNLEERYRNDAAFNKVVNSLRNMISEHGFTPSELREALFMAHYQYEIEDPRALERRVMNILNFVHRDPK